jgi:hypothetical protein
MNEKEQKEQDIEDLIKMHKEELRNYRKVK